MSGPSEYVWVQLWQRLGREAPKGVYENLVQLYGEPHRGYHNLEHVMQCLYELEKSSRLAVDANAVAVALWFHDAVYDTKAEDNEEQSMALAVSVLEQAGLGDDFIQKVAKLIMATKHTAAPVDVDAQLIVDIDLSILGQSAANFDRYERQIRQEYSWVPPEMFNPGRKAILQSFLARPRIFSLEYFHNKYESVARGNLARSIEALS